MDIWKATKRDVMLLSELFRQGVKYNQRLARYYELLPDFDWVTYTEEKLKSRNRIVFVAGNNICLTGFIYIRIINYPPNNLSKTDFHNLLSYYLLTLKVLMKGK